MHELYDSMQGFGRLALVVFEGFAGFLTADGDELLGFVERLRFNPVLL